MFIVFMFIVAGIFDFSRATFYYNSLAEAARAGARYGIVHGENATNATGPCAVASGASCTCDDSDTTSTSDPPYGADIRTAVLTRTTGMAPSGVTVTCYWPDSSASGIYLNSRNKRVKVIVNYTYQPVMGAFIPWTLTLTGETASFIQY